MNDLFKREKHGELPRPISEGGERAYEYALGDVASSLRGWTLPSTT